MTAPGTSPVCFVLRVKPALVAEYRERHDPVWPDMLRAIRDSGWSNYSIFLNDDGLVVGYFETDDLPSALERMHAFEVDARWAQETAHLFEGPPVWLPMTFNLGHQLARLAEVPSRGADDGNRTRAISLGS